MQRRIWSSALCTMLILLAATIRPAPALAQTGQPQEGTQNLTIFTQYPSQEAAIGETITFALKLRGGAAPQVVNLEVQDLPTEWKATFRGGGKIVHSAYVTPTEDTAVDLRVEPPQTVSAGTYRFVVLARGTNAEARLPIELILQEQLPPSLHFDIDLPTLRGTPDTTFRYNATLRNDGDKDIAVNLVADAPQAFQVSFKLSGQDVTSIPLAAKESKSLSIEARALSSVPAGAYQINVQAQGGEAQASTTLTAEVTGQPELSVTAPDGRLSGQAYAGSDTPITLVVQNTGSAPARGIELSASPPSGWSVTFDPEQIPEVPSGQQVNVTAHVRPAEQAVAGDYMVTITARPAEGASKSADFRITVLTSTLWGIVGVVLIAVAVGVVGLAVARFGRR